MVILSSPMIVGQDQAPGQRVETCICGDRHGTLNEVFFRIRYQRLHPAQMSGLRQRETCGVV